jgi:iron complex outermembrane receptor protein
MDSPLTTYSNYTSLNLNCANGTYTDHRRGARGTGCKYNLVDTYQPDAAPAEALFVQRPPELPPERECRRLRHRQLFARAMSASRAAPRGHPCTQPFGGAPALASSNPGIVLPVWICPTGANCADPAAVGRRLNPNNPYAAAFAGDPANGAARIYYLFGDIPAGSDRTNEVIRGAAGLKGLFGGDWNWRVEAVGARDNLRSTQYGFLNIANLLNAINTGATTSSIRRRTRPPCALGLADRTTPSHSSLMSLDASITKTLWTLPGGDMQLAFGAQIRKEVLVNNNQNAKLDTYGLTTSSAFGKHTVKAGYLRSRRAGARQPRAQHLGPLR